MSLFDDWRFCPRCGGTLTIAADHLACAACGGQYWANSIPGVQGILERDGRVLLARRGREPRLGHWDLPGGFLAEGEEPLDGLRREFREETGLEVEPIELYGIDIEPYAGRFVFSVTWLVTARRRTGRRRRRRRAALVRARRLPAEMAFPGKSDCSVAGREAARRWAERLM